VVGAAAVAGGVATIVSLLESRPAAVLSVHMGPPEWAEQSVTLGSYLAWQHRESRELGLRALDGAASAMVNSGAATHAEAKPTGIRLASYTAPLHELGTTSGQSTTPIHVHVFIPEKNTRASSAGSETGVSNTSSGTETGSSFTPIAPTGPGAGSSTESSETASGGAPVGSSHGSPPSLLAGALREAAGHLSHAARSHLENRVKGQEEVLANSRLQPSPKVVRACTGVGYGGCSPADPAVEVPVEGPKEGAEGPKEGVEGATEGTETTTTHTTFTSTNEHLTQAPPGQSQRELVELADSARRGSAVDASLVPPMLTAGLSPSQRARIVSVLGDAVSFDLHTRGWVGQQLWLTWTMYEKREGHWNPSSQQYLIDHAEAYLVPAAVDDEGILTFWFPIPRQPGEYQVRYFIRAPGGRRKLAAGKTHTFNS
jgi:hypothetical protein